jgi:hypothetical protein
MAPAISLLFALARLALHSPMPWIPQLWLTLLVTSVTLVSPFTLPPVYLLLLIKATTHYIGIFAGFKIEFLSVAVSFVAQIPSRDQQDSLHAGRPDVVMSDTHHDLALPACLLSSYSAAHLLANSHNSATVDGQSTKQLSVC